MTSPIPDGTAEAYEGLRRQVIEPDTAGEQLEGCGILKRCGLAAWAQARPLALSAQTSESHFQSASKLPVLDSLGTELVQLLASLILSIRQEGFLHA